MPGWEHLTQVYLAPNEPTDYDSDADESTKLLIKEMNKSNLQRYKESVERPPPPDVSINVVEDANIRHEPV
jgi:hypothetical protein